MPALAPAIRWLLQRVPDPFSQGRVDNPWDLEPVDVEAINAAAFQACLDLVRDVRHRRESHGLLLTGQPGAGKTHVLSRLRARLLSEQFALFVYVLPITAPDRFFRHLLRAVGADLLRPAPARPAISQLEVALARHALEAPRAPVDQCASYWLEARRLFEHPIELLEHLRLRLSAAFDRLGVEPGLADVALQHAAGVQRAAARGYLMGRSLSDAQLEALGLGQALDEEEDAEAGLAGLLKLCAEPVVLAFDQIEGLEVNPGDDAGLRGFGNGVAALFARAPHNVAAVTCLQVAFSQRLRDTLGTALFEGRIAERRAELQPLNEAGALALVEARLAAAPYLASVRHYAHDLAAADGGEFTARDDRLWPLAEEVVRGLARARPPARALLAACREYFDRTVRGEPAGIESDVPAADPTPIDEASDHGRADALGELWDEVRTQRLQIGSDIVDEGVYSDGLLKLAAAQVRPGLDAERSRAPDIDIVLTRGADRIGVAVCHADNMKSLAARLRRLREARTAGLTRVVVVRDARLPIPRTAAATRDRLEVFRAEGGLVEPGAEVYAALAALRELLSRSAAGDLEIEGRVVDPGELKRWLAQNPDPALEGLLSSVLDAERRQGELPPEVGDVMRQRLVVALSELARVSGVGERRVLALADASGSGLLVLAGPPAVVLLSPDLLERP